MKTTQIGKHKVEIYDSIDALPVLRFHAFNKMMLVDSGIGSDLNDWDAHAERVIRFIMSDDKESAIKEMNNLRQNIYLVQSGVSPRHMAFAALVKSIDGVEYDDLTTEGLAKVNAMIKEATDKEIAANTEAVKKKIDEELAVYFPQTQDDPKNKEYHDLMRRRAILQCEKIINETDEYDAEIEQLTTKLLTFTKPKDFSGKDSVEVQYDKQFENMCLIISKELNANAKQMTVLEYYNAFEFVKDMQKQKQQKSKKQ